MKGRTLSNESIQADPSETAELDKLLFDFSVELDNISTILSLQGVVVSLSSVVNESTPIDRASIESHVYLAKRIIQEMDEIIISGKQASRVYLDSTVERVNGYSRSIQDTLNVGAKYMGADIDQKKMYYFSLQVAFDFRKLVFQFNDLLGFYKWKRTLHIKLADTSLEFYTMSEDILLDHKFDDVR
jgi:hypothetical protein